MSEILKFHLDNDFTILLENIEELNAIKITLPERKIYTDFKVRKTWKIYESNLDELIVYKNGKIVKKIDHAQFSHRPLIEFDLINTCQKYKVDDNLIICTDCEKNKYGIHNIYTMLSTDNLVLEKEFMKLVNKMILNKPYEHILKKYNFDKEIETVKEIAEIGGY